VRAAAADVQLGVALLQAAFSGAQTNLERKLSSLTDTLYITSVVDEIARLSEEATAATRAAESIVRRPQA
jgi:formiminotetrahydrofolate cyclodeaminase